MKLTLMDRFIGAFSPDAALRRLHARATLEVMRGYDAAQTYNTSDWVSANKSSANSEIKAAQASLRDKARDLGRNNPYALRAVDVIVANTVGAGIVANIRGKNKTQTKKLMDLWSLWAETPLIDYERRQDFYGLQSLAMRAIVESGENLTVRQYLPIPASKGKVQKYPLKGIAPALQILEGDFLNIKKDEGSIVQGVELSPTGERLKYHIFKNHPGDRAASEEMQVLPADQVVHAYKQQRPGQIRGVPWAHAVIEKLKDFEDFQRATLIRQKVSACLMGFIETTGSEALLSAAARKLKRESDFSMEPATVRYLNPGEKYTHSSPPGVDGYSDFNRETMRAVAAGYGVSYEALTGDYSQSNYSSSRMGHIEFRRNIEAWRWNMLIPLFCQPAFEWFLEWAALQGVQIDGATVEWVPPAHSMIDPTKEIEALKKEVRSGFKTYGEAVREQGRDPEKVLAEFAEWNEKFDKAKVSFDSDPRRMSMVGLAQSVDVTDTEESTDTDEEEDSEQDQTDAAEESDSSGAE